MGRKWSGSGRSFGGPPLCAFYLRMGKCKYEGECKFSHDAAAGDKSKIPTCKFWLEGNCKYGNNCMFSHMSDGNLDELTIQNAQLLTQATAAQQLGLQWMYNPDGTATQVYAQSAYGQAAMGYGYPAQTAGYPPQTGGYPAQTGAYPAQSGAYPPQSGAYPPQQQYPPVAQYPAQYPAAQPGYPPMAGQPPVPGQPQAAGQPPAPPRQAPTAYPGVQVCPEVPAEPGSETPKPTAANDPILNQLRRPKRMLDDLVTDAPEPKRPCPESAPAGKVSDESLESVENRRSAYSEEKREEKPRAEPALN